jgi:hypothetical protein
VRRIHGFEELDTFESCRPPPAHEVDSSRFQLAGL